MKTPEEIKKGLEVCSTGAGCIQCPYDEPNLCHGIENKADALAYIQQLEERNSKLEYTLLGVMHSVDKWLDVEPYDFDKDDGTVAATRASNAREIALKAIAKAQADLSQVEREKDAAVTAISNAKHYIQYGMKKLENWDYSIKKSGSEYKTLTSATRSPFAIEELKTALMEAREICGESSFCSPECPFYVPLLDCCPMKFKNYPEEWDANGWKEDSNA